MLEGLLHVHVEHVADAPALEPDVKGLAAEPLALANRAGHPDVGEEVHLQAVRAVAVAGLAPAPRDVEAEPARRVAARLRLGKLREQVANLVEQLDVGRRVRTRRPADRRLVDVDHLVEVLESLDPVVRARLGDGPVQVARKCLAKDVAHQRAFSRARNPRHADKKPQRKRRVDRLSGCYAVAP